MSKAIYRCTHLVNLSAMIQLMVVNMKLIAFLFFQKYRLAKYLPESPADGRTVCLSLFHSFIQQQLVCLSMECIDLHLYHHPLLACRF